MDNHYQTTTAPRLRILTAFFLLAVCAQAQTTVSVNLADSIRPVTHCASGSLYGMTEALPADIANHVIPLKPNTFVQPAMSGSGHQQPIGDALKVSERLASTTGKVQIRLADILPGWPYNWPGQSSWLASVKALILSKLATGRKNYDGYELWNEPDGTWKSENGNFEEVLWKPTYDLVRSLDPTAKIIGPSYSFYADNKMSTFLKYCKTNNCLPDVVSWHQWGSGGFIGALEQYRAVEKSVGISPRAISINEYSSETHEYEGSPGVSVPFIAKFERNNVESAMISWWFTALPGRLGSLLTAKNEKGGGWWLYKWYGDMSGYMAKVTPPKDKSDGIDGFAALDKNARYASIVIGGNNVGSSTINIQGIPSTWGSEVSVKVESVEWVNKDTPVTGTKELSSTKATVSANAITVPINIESQFNAYRIYIVPTQVIEIPQTAFSPNNLPGTLQAENFDNGGPGVAYFDSDTENKGAEQSYRSESIDLETNGQDIVLGYTIAGEWLEYEVDILQDGPFDITYRVASELETGKFLLWIDGVAITDTLSAPNTGSWDTYSELPATTQALTKGKHILKISIEGSYFNLDWISFAAQSTPLLPAQHTVKQLYSSPPTANYDLLGREKARASPACSWRKWQ